MIIFTQASFGLRVLLLPGCVCVCVCLSVNHQLVCAIPPIQVSISKFWPKMHLSTVEVPIDFGLDWSWCSVSFLISNLFILPKFVSHYSFASVCIYLVRPIASECCTFHMAPHIYGFLYVRRQGRTMDLKQSSFISWWDHRSSMSRRLDDWHWILLVLVKLYTPHMP